MLISSHSRRECTLAVSITAIFFLWSALMPATLLAQQTEKTDTLKVSVAEAEKIFLEQNLPVLAERLNIDQGEARILQAKAWPNPTFHLDGVQLYNTPNTDPSPGLLGTNFWRNRTFEAQLEQMVKLAGKRKKGIAFETRSKELAESSFTDFLLNLKAEFRQDLAELQYLQSVAGDLLYQRQVVNDLIRGQSAQYKQGNISQSQLYRIKALQIALESDLNDLNEKITEKQQSLKTAMALAPTTFIQVTGTDGEVAMKQLKQYTLSRLIDISLQHNASLKSADREKKVNEAALAVEKANAVPDLTFNVNYDRNGNNQLDFVGAGVAIDLPVFNRNKGNIRVARYELQKSELMQKNKTNEVSNAVVKTWSDLNKAIDLYEGIDKDYLQKLNEMTASLSLNFQQKNVSLLEFLDFFESFKESRQRYYEAVKNITQKKEDLNYLAGQDL
ncbi:TolC family protein [Taibaiella chishuiensis]|uniref:Cobalt-zinc-cadmium efflux system outer membrane protein n=1 Tax=Taibaiella chishuiensis TaxID=1434707 RepID=A0A2P8D4S2_9BACT|nr:TolC family protein [Taibaiella chishuiensis]PSK92214.1 cobalt-zinc-cadmium efflux system outer membrane protein [Taibaiella chishuiensis]